MIKTVSAALVAALAGSTAMAADLVPMTFQMSWKAQAEQGGYWLAAAEGYYEECGLDVTVRSGGPGIDTTQLLVTGAVEAILVSQNDGAMRMNQAGFPSKAVMAAFQKLPTILLYHDEAGISEPADMAGKPVMISQGNRQTFWPFMKDKWGLSDDQLRSYNGQIAVWMQNGDSIQQGIVTNEPFRIKEQAGFDASYFLLADYGYDPYTSVVVVPQTLIDGHPEQVQCLVDGSVKGWTEFMADPEAGFAAVQEANPENSDELMAYSYGKMKELNLIENGDTAAHGIGAMTDERWAAHFGELVKYGQFPADFDYKSAYTLQFLD
ncbi:ABC transporter substrate-binding protein [Mangrovicoccus sp. HB161399]|uniref:ABC transporter substrate-binding protein n=1 Tax=Mangrovicoccus sp. HB161399 TaxID=2720392 RepID=UPI001554EC33|nr:ABC transporter substrate-binding protein [Mangrovicoccus sp. HB161399]